MSVKVICFSKDRAMQLEAYLESLIFYTNINPSDITVITPNIVNDTRYITLSEKLNGVNFLAEIDGFDYTYRHVVDQLKNDDVVLFGTDDVIYHNYTSPAAIRCLFDVEDILGVSLRLSSNTFPFFMGCVPSEKVDSLYTKFYWPGSPSHFGYPIDVSCSAYPARLIKLINKCHPDKFRIPNDLESVAVGLVSHNIEVVPKHIVMMTEKPVCSIVDLNRVQDLYPNRINGDLNTTPEKLNQLFDEGYRIDWKKYQGICPSDPFIGKQHLSFYKV